MTVVILKRIFMSNLVGVKITAPDLASFGARISALSILSPRLFGVLRFLRNWGEQKEVTRLL